MYVYLYPAGCDRRQASPLRRTSVPDEGDRCFQLKGMNIIGSQCFQLKMRGIHLCAHGDLDPVLTSRSQPGTCISVSFSLLIGIDHPCIYFNTPDGTTEDTKRRIYYFSVLCYGSFCTNRRIKKSGLTAIRQAPVIPPAPIYARSYPRSRAHLGRDTIAETLNLLRSHRRTHIRIRKMLQLCAASFQPPAIRIKAPIHYTRRHFLSRSNMLQIIYFRGICVLFSVNPL